MKPRAGVVTFAGALFLVLAFLNAIDGVIAFADPGHFYVSENGLLLIHDYGAYGLILLVIAGIQLVVGWGIIVRAHAAQAFGILIAIVSALVHLAYFEHYPAWTAIALVLDGIVLYALTMHGDEFAPTEA